MLPTSKIEEVSQKCCASDVVKFKIEEVSQSSFVFKLADRQIDKSIDRWIDRQLQLQLHYTAAQIPIQIYYATVH